MPHSSLDSERDEGFEPARFTTHLLPKFQQFDAWRQFMSPVAEISLVNNDTKAFEIDHLSWRLGDITLEQTFLPQTAERRWRHLPKSFMDHWCLVLANSHRPGATANGSNGSSRQISFRSLTKPFEGQGTDEQVLTLYLPRDLFRKEARSLDNAHGMVLTSWQSAILADYLTVLARELPSISRKHLPGLSAATCSLVRACLAPIQDDAAEAEKPIVVALRERAARIVRQNMASADFGPEALGRLLSVSRSKLYRIFESSGGVARFIQQKRLAEAHLRLTHTQNKTPISALAAEVGFSDHSAFSRAFKLEYGYSPSEAREIALATRLLDPQIWPEAADDDDMERAETT